MKLNSREKLILIGVLNDTAELAKTDPYASRRTGPALGGLIIKRDDARNGYVLTNAAAWTGNEPSGSEHVMLSRAYKKLESLGLVERANLYGSSNRTTHLRLTETGKQLALHLTESGAGPPAEAA